MEAAPRPPLEALPELPAEEPPDSAKVRAAAPAAAGAAPASAEADKPEDSSPTGLNFIDPEMFLAAGQAASAVPVVNAAEQTAKAPEPSPELELLEDPVVDDLLTAPPPPPAPPPPTPAAALKSNAESPAEAAAVRAAARVPIAKTASLSAAATKLAAASGAGRPAASPAATGKPAAAPAAAPASAAATKGEAAAKPAAAAPKPTPATTAKAESPAAKLDAPSLASWASARAAAAQKARPAAAPAAAPGAPAAAKTASSRPAATATPAAAAPPATPAPPAAAANVVPPAPVMDRDFIARNQVVERYLSGRLPLKAATEFERYCHDHPEMLDQLGLPERVNAGLRLLEAAGKPEPWQEAPRPAWQKPAVTLALAVAVVVLGIALAGVAASNSSKSHRMAELQKQNSERALDPATSTREIRLLPSRSGASNSPAITIGGGAGGAQLADLKIDESRSPYHTFRITIDRIDQGRVAVISGLDKDSNGHLRIALNSSALGPGNYQLTLEGLDWRGQPQPDSWVTIGIQH
ncbi:MAG TPA: hypothetical protein VEQ14_09735 [Steroidobacteraceae bacterium]|nr:hypothetical protein [Steroidobacteraceae bacterium]